MSRSPRLGADIKFDESAVGTGWISFTFSRRSRIILKGRLNGASHDILLDSGAEITIIDQNCADALKLLRVGSTIFTDRNNVTRTPIAQGISIALPGLAISPNEVVLADLQSICTMTGLRISAILGREIFERAIVDIDFNKARIRFLPFGEFAPPAGAHTVPLRKFEAGHGRVIDVRLGSHGNVALEFDLGSANPIVLQRSCWERTRLSEGKRSNSLIGGVGGIRETYLVSLPSIQIGSFRVHEVDALLEINSGEMEHRLGDGIIGMPVISKFRTITDYKRDNLYLVSLLQNS